jgi:hypothetical protein
MFSMAVSAFGADAIGEYLERLKRSKDEADRVRIIAVDLWESEDHRVSREFSKMLSAKVTEEDYFVAQYLAKLGNTNALRILVRNAFEYPVSSWQWSFTLREFGKKKYKPAIPVLIDGLDAASFNVVEEAQGALAVFYPDSPTNFTTLRDMKDYFQKRYRSASKVSKRRT